jgi:hypothetical protein
MGPRDPIVGIVTAILEDPALGEAPCPTEMPTRVGRSSHGWGVRDCGRVPPDRAVTTAGEVARAGEAVLKALLDAEA